MEAGLPDLSLTKEKIVKAFEQEKLNVEITENKMGNIVVSRMCELFQNQVFEQTVSWDDTVERAMKEKVSSEIKPALRKMIVQEQHIGKPMKPILTLAGPLPSRNSFTFDLVFLFRLDQCNEQVLHDTIQLIYKIDQYIASVRPN